MTTQDTETTSERVEQDRYHVCVTCGRLKHEDLFEIGACTCDDCKSDGREAVNWREAPDGDGFVSKQSGAGR